MIQQSPRADRRAASKRSRQARAWAAKAGPVSAGQLLARTEGPCWHCPNPIRLGDPIALYVVNAQDKWWGHSECVAAARLSAAGAGM